jgi:peptidoglycan/LPS O-acetylase OafA/YrhL
MNRSDRSLSASQANLDVLRALAVLFVVAGHSAKFFGARPFWAGPFARTGVYLFFVHTSLVLMMSLERTLRRHRPASRLLFLANFYGRRFFRIYPASIVAVVLVSLFAIPQSHIEDAFRLALEPFRWPAFWSNLALTMNLTGAKPILGQLWSLPFEVQMYLLLPFLFLFARRHGWRGVLTGWIGSGAIGLVWMTWLSTRPGWWRLSLLRYIPCFLPGILAFTLYRIRPRINGRWWLPAVLSLCAAYLLGYGGVDGWRWTHWFLCLTIGAAIPLFHSMSEGPVTRASYHVAKYSYGIYLTHLFALWLAFIALRLPIAVQVAVWLTCLVAAPVVLYHGVEEPMMRWGAKLMARFETPAAATRAAAA